MDTSIFFQFLINGLMLGMVYALVAVGFTLFFGVLDVIVFSHGETVMLGGFAGLSVYMLAQALAPGLPLPVIGLLMALVSLATVSFLGVFIAKRVVIPLKGAPALNVLLATMMLGTILREGVRLFFPDGSNPKPFPQLLPDWAWQWGNLTVRFDNVVLFISGAALIVAIHMIITRTRLGMAIRAVAQDAEAAQLMGVNFTRVILATFILGCVAAAFAGFMNGMYYSEINFGLGLLLGAIGFSAAVIGGLGNIYGAILGGFIFAFLQTSGAVLLPFSSAYKDVFAFGVVILIMAWRPTGILPEPSSQRV